MPQARRLRTRIPAASGLRSPTVFPGKNAWWASVPSSDVQAPRACGRTSPRQSAASARLSAFASHAARRAPIRRGTSSRTSSPQPNSGCSTGSIPQSAWSSSSSGTSASRAFSLGVERDRSALVRERLRDAPQGRRPDRRRRGSAGAREVEHVVRVLPGTRDRVRGVVERPTVRLRRDLPPGDRGPECGRGDEVALEPARDIAVQEGAAPGGDGPVLGVVGVGRERDEAVERVHEVVRGGLVRDVAQGRRARADLPQGLAARADGLVRPDPLADPGSPPGEAARLADGPLLVDLHRLERPLDRVQAQVLRAHPSFSYRTRPGHRAVGGTSGRLPRGHRAGALARS